MTEKIQRPPPTVWLGFSLVSGLLGLALLISFFQIHRSSQLPQLPVLGSIAAFTLTNQDGQITTLADFSNHVWVADIVFTRCAGPCPRMTGQMKLLQNFLPSASTAKLVTLTTDPENDSPAVLKKYGQRFDVDFNRWTFLTGTKKRNRRTRQRQSEVERAAGETRRPERRRRSFHSHHNFCHRR